MSGKFHDDTPNGSGVIVSRGIQTNKQTSQTDTTENHTTLATQRWAGGKNDQFSRGAFPQSGAVMSNLAFFPVVEINTVDLPIRTAANSLIAHTCRKPLILSEQASGECGS